MRYHKIGFIKKEKDMQNRIKLIVILLSIISIISCSTKHGSVKDNDLSIDNEFSYFFRIDEMYYIGLEEKGINVPPYYKFETIYNANFKKINRNENKNTKIEVTFKPIDIKVRKNDVPKELEYITENLIYLGMYVSNFIKGTKYCIIEFEITPNGLITNSVVKEVEFSNDLQANLIKFSNFEYKRIYNEVFFNNLLQLVWWETRLDYIKDENNLKLLIYPYFFDTHTGIIGDKSVEKPKYPIIKNMIGKFDDFCIFRLDTNQKIPIYMNSNLIIEMVPIKEKKRVKKIEWKISGIGDLKRKIKGKIQDIWIQQIVEVSWHEIYKNN